MPATFYLHIKALKKLMRQLQEMKTKLMNWQKEIKGKIDADENFTELAKKYSDDSGSAVKGGKLTTPVNGSGTYVYDFEKTALALEKDGM